MYSRLATIGELLAGSLRGGLTWRRAGALIGGSAAHFPMLCVVNGARVVDQLLAPEVGKVPVRGPVFVVAIPRSGTTFLHHLLSLDDEHFTHQRLYQTVLPSIALDQAAAGLSTLDDALRGSLSRVMTRVNARLFAHWKGIHSVELDQPEEDESLFVYALLSPALYLLMPFIDQVPHLRNLDSLSGHLEARIARDYRATVQRHLLRHGLNREGRARTLLVKNVLLPSRLQLTKTAFPEARFVRLVRDPHHSIPSAMSLFYSAWAVHSPDLDKRGPEVRALFEMFVEHYRRLHREATGPDGHNVLTVRFEHLIADPIGAVRRTYDFLGLPFRASYQQRLATAVEAADSFKSAHAYSLEEFGLSARDIDAVLFDVQTELGYDTPRPGSRAAQRPRHGEWMRPPPEHAP